MQVWKSLLLIVPAGLAIGLLAGRVVDPGTMRADEPVGARREALAPAYDPPPDSAPAPTRTEDDQALASPDRGRPELDWEEEAWPGDYSRGAYAYDDNYFGDAEDGGSGWVEYGEARRAPTGRSEAPRAPTGRSEAEDAARAADRAARDALREATVAPPAPPVRARPPAPAAAPTPPPEPRAANGDLPAIW